MTEQSFCEDRVARGDVRSLDITRVAPVPEPYLLTEDLLRTTRRRRGVSNIVVEVKDSSKRHDNVVSGVSWRERLL